MKNILYVLFLAGLSLALFSCSSNSSTSSTASTTEVEGTWITSCFQSGSYYRIQTITITGTDVVAKYEFHTDSSCSTDYLFYEDTYSSLAIGDSVTFSSGSTGHKFSLNVVSFKTTLQVASLVSASNTASYCGFSDWELNTVKDYTGKTVSSILYPVANTTFLGMYKLVGNNLFLGDFISTGSYPTLVYNTIIYVKQ